MSRAAEHSKRHPISTAEPPSEQQYRRLQDFFSSAGRVIVAFSGGVDSSLVLKAAVDTLGGANVLGVTAISPSLAERELIGARLVAREIGARHREIETCELDNPAYSANGRDRCYHCKSELFSRLKEIQEREHYDLVVSGANKDDLSDYRPGHRAARQFGVQAPLQQIGLTKADIRNIARHLDLSVHGKPAAPCLASRIPYDRPVSAARLKQIELAEEILHSLGFREFRVRHHDEIARLEISSRDFLRFEELELRLKVESELQALGFQFVTLDLKPFQSGNLNRLPDTTELPD